jgi:uncharacterized membrane protein YadS
MPIEWSSLWKREDWWAVWLGFVILALVATKTLGWIPKISIWTNDLGAAVIVGDVPHFILLGISLLVLTSVAILAIGERITNYAVGFPIVFILAFLSQLVANQSDINGLGLAYALWALFFGLLIRNIFGIPKFLEAAVKGELFIKIGLVLLGAEILFDVILQAGSLCLFEVTIGLAIVWYFCYYVARKLGLTRSLSAIMANAASVCGVSAAIAAGGATKGDKKEIGYVISLVLLFAAPMMVLMPVIGRFVGMPDAVFGAWVGGTIDNTASVVASGALYSEQAMTVASVVKMSQNILIGITAFVLALYWVFKVERNSKAEKPKPIEIWYRFPKFILGFLVASILFTFIMVPLAGTDTVIGMLKITKGFRGWFFALTFVSIGLSTNFSELIKIGKGKPVIVFIAATVFDLVVSLITAYAFFGGIFFPPPV